MSNKYNNTITNRHFIPVIREWSNSVYYFNKNNLKEVYSKDYISNNIIQSYFKLTPKPSKNNRSKRMRDLIRRSTTRQLFASRSYIKQTSDKSIITVYLFDREQKRYNTNLFYLNEIMYNTFNYLNFNKINNHTNSIRHILTPSKKYNNSITSKKFINPSKLSNRNKSVSNEKVKQTNRLSKYNNWILSVVFNKTNTISVIFYFYFFKWVLLLTGLRLDILYKGDYIRYQNNDIVINNKSFIIYKSRNNKNILYSKDRINKLINVDNNYLKLFKLSSKLKTNNIRVINNIMYKYICLYISNMYNINNNSYIRNKLHMLYEIYYNIFYNSFKNKFLIQQYYTIFNLYRLHINNVKLKQLLPGLKLLLNNVYNKDIELNLVKLKYLHLNSDIYMESILVKLRKKSSKLLRILKKSLMLIKIPKKIHIDKIKLVKPVNVISKFKGLNINNYISNTKDKINQVLCNIYLNKYYVNNKDIFNTDIFNSIKYKWVTGVKLEAKGRLTRRYTASRSLFKSRYKGNLRNLDYMNVSTTSVKNEKDILQTPSLHMVRNQVKPNIQYTMNNSKKRIGTFGIKGWINSN